MSDSAKHSDKVLGTNARAWDALARSDAVLARPARDSDFANPLATIDPLGWLGGDIRGWHVLCLAAGGGRQSALYAAAGADVTVVDLSSEMLALDRKVASERQLAVKCIEASMDDLSMLARGQFDAVIHPVSTCYVPDVAPVFREVARVCRPGGLYISQHKTPVSLQASLRPAGHGYLIEEKYYRRGPLPACNEPSRLRESGAIEFLHRWEQLIGGICRAGLVVEDLIEPMHADQENPFGERAQYIAPYVRIKARRVANDAASSAIIT